MAQTRAQQRLSRSRKRRFKKRLKQLTWAGVLVAIGAAVFHTPSVSTAQAATDGQNVSDGTKQLQFLTQALSATGAHATNYAVHDWTIMNQQFLTPSEVASIGTNLVQEFNLQNAKVTTRSEKNQTYWQVDGQWPNSLSVRVVLTSLDGGSAPDGQASGNETVLTVTALSADNSTDGFVQAYDRIENVVSASSVTPQMSAYIKGSIGQEVTEGTAKQLAAWALSQVHATPVESLNSQWETSVSGYTNDALTYIYTNGKRMNVQVAVHTDTYNHRTDVLVGTPIITTTY